MKHIRTIIQIRLRHPEESERQIAIISRCSRPVVAEYLSKLEEHPVDEQALGRLNDLQLAEHLGITRPAIQETAQNRELSTWLDKHHQRLHEKHMTRRLLHEHYSQSVEAPLQYSQFCMVLQKRSQESGASGMFEHKAGDKLYIDFTGSKFLWQEENGLVHSEEVYLAVLGASSYFFALPVLNQRQDTFCNATQAAFEYFGGVPHAVVPDCLKSAVLSHDGYEPVHNPLFARLLAHYRVVSIPARPHHPKDKPIAETTVKLVYTRMLAKLNGRVFSDRQAMLSAWNKELRAVNDARFQKMSGSRKSKFEAVDKPALKSLPPKPFALTDVLTQTVKTTLAVHVPADQTSYSVPAVLQGKQVEVVITADEIEVWHANHRYATHQRSPGSGKVIHTEHLPAAQRWYATRNTTEVVRALHERGPHVGRWAAKVLSDSEHEDIAWPILEGLRSLATKNPPLIDRACRIALTRELFTLKAVRVILSSGQALAAIEHDNQTTELPFHENVRGGEYFAKGGSV